MKSGVQKLSEAVFCQNVVRSAEIELGGFSQFAKLFHWSEKM